MTLILNDDQPRGLGYLEVDNRGADLPPGAAKHFEADTYTCSHCQYVVVMNPLRKRIREKCARCNHHICDICAKRRDAGVPCQTFAEKAEEALKREQARQPGSGYLLLP